MYIVGGLMENLSTVIERLKKLQQNLSEIGDSLWHFKVRGDL